MVALLLAGNSVRAKGSIDGCCQALQLRGSLNPCPENPWLLRSEEANVANGDLKGSGLDFSQRFLDVAHPLALSNKFQGQVQRLRAYPLLCRRPRNFADNACNVFHDSLTDFLGQINGDEEAHAE